MRRGADWIRGAAAAIGMGVVGCGGGAAGGAEAPGAVIGATAGSPAAGPGAAVPAAPLAGMAAPVRRAALRFEVGEDDFPAPLVDVMVSGHPTTMIVDTGATHQVVASWVADEVGTTVASGDVGIDHTGRRLSLGRLSGGTIAVTGWGAIDASAAVVTAVPAALQRLGIGGVVSPQALATEGTAVVLDLRKKVMAEAPLAEALAALEREPGAAVTGEVRSCGPGGGALVFVRASVAGVEVEAQLDTGATESTVRAGSEAGARIAAAAKAQTTAIAASGVFTVPVVEGALVKVGALETTADVGLVKKDARPVCPNDALLGMDVLRRCVLVLGAKVMAGRCSAPR